MIGDFFFYVSVLLCTLSYYVYLKVFRRSPRLVEFAKTLPGPPSLPVIGHGLDFFWDGMEGVDKILEYTNIYGPLYRLWFGKHLTLVMSKSEDLQAVFLSSKMLDKPDMCAPFHELLGNSLFTVPGHAWRKQRKQIQPLYVKKVVPYYEENINKILHRYLDKIAEAHLDGPEFDLMQYVPFLVFDITTRTNFDIELSAEENTLLNFHACAKKLSSAMFWQAMRPWLHVRLFRHLYNWFGGINFARKEVFECAAEITRKQLPLLRESAHVMDTNSQDSGIMSSPFPFLTATYPKENDNLITMYDEIVTMISAATDTTSTSTSSFLLMAAMYPEVQKNLWEELDKVFGDDDREATISDFDHLPYLDLVFRETQRRFSPVPLVFRKVQEDSKIGDLKVPAGTALLINLRGIHHNPEYYKDPFKFDPNRFLPEEVEKRPRYSYIPFSGGIRNCVGSNYALLVVKLAVIAFLRTFEFETTEKLENIEMVGGFTNVSKNGYKVRIVRRKSVYGRRH